MKNLLKNKAFFIFIFILFMFILFMFSDVEATITTNFNGTTLNFPDIPDTWSGYPVTDFFIFRNSNGKYYLHISNSIDFNSNEFVKNEKVVLSNSSSSSKKYYRFVNSNNAYSQEARYDLKNNQWTYSDSGFDGLNLSYSDIIISTLDIYYNNTIVFANNYTLRQTYSIDVSTTSMTYEPITFFSNWFNKLDVFLNTSCYICTDLENLDNWESLQRETFTDSSTGISKYRFYYTIMSNGYYAFKFVNNKTNDILFTITYTIQNIAFDIYYDTNLTDKPVQVYTDDFPFDSNINVQISTDLENWQFLNNNLTSNNEGNITSNSKFWYYIFKNGTYYFKFSYINIHNLPYLNNVHYCIIKKDINNILIGDYMSDDYIFSPKIYLDFNSDTDSYIIKTQNILLDKALNLKCFYTTTDNLSNDLSTWNEMDINFNDNYILNNNGILSDIGSEAYFYFEIPAISAEDTDYKILFFNYFSGKTSNTIIYNFIVSNAQDYVQNELGIDLSINIRLNGLLRYFKERFGFLTYPFEFITTLFNKISNINYKEPIIHIPQIKIPTTDIIIFNGMEYNFNLLLENNAIAYIYNIYLIAVDVILIVGFIILCKNTIMEVFSK